MSSSIFQTKEWEDFKLNTGYEKSYRIDDLFVLQKKLPFGRTMLYSPMVDQNIEYRIKNKAFLEEVKKTAKENNSIFYRLELGFATTNDQLLTTDGFVKAFEEMQPENTIILDISKSEEEILAQMKPKGRYNIKIAEKNGIEIQKTTNIDAFYHLYETMAKRQKISYRSRKYFQNLIDILGKSGYCEVFEATLSKRHCEERSDEAIFCVDRPVLSEVEGLPRPDGLAMTKQNDAILASAIISFYDNTAIYLFGGSSNEHRNLMAPYKLHWEIIKEAKRRGLTKYDFFGIAPQNQPNHPWAGVTRFKQQFGGEEVELLGSWDLIFKPTEYQLFKVLEKMRRK